MTTITDSTSTSVASTVDTFTSTSTETDSTTTTVSVTTTTTITAPTFTVTGSTSTTTIATPAGFQYPSPVPAPPAKKRDTLADHHPEPQRFPPQAIQQRRDSSNGISRVHIGSDGKKTCSPARYPTSVICGAFVEVLSTVTKTSTETTSTMTITAITATTTASTTITTTNTIPYEASTTITVSTTTTLTFSSTTTITATTSTTPTITYTPPEATFYAACSPQNVLSAPAGYYIESENYNPPTFQSSVSAATSYDCCVACITNPFCKIAEFGPENAGCALDFGSSQTSCASGLTVSVGLESPPLVHGLVLSVGNCGGTLNFSYD